MQPEETNTTLDTCLGVEAKLREIRQLLLDARPEAIDRCQDEIQKIAGALQGLMSARHFPHNPGVRSTLLGIRLSAQALRHQADYASNLCSGWLQLRLGAGYTQHGRPVLVRSDPGSSFEA